MPSGSSGTSRRGRRRRPRGGGRRGRGGAGRSGGNTARAVLWWRARAILRLSHAITWHHVPSYVSSCGRHMSSCVSSRVIRPAEVRRQARTLVDLGPWLVTKRHCRLRGRSGGFTPFGARGRLCMWGQGSRQKPPYLPLDFVVNRKLREKSKVFRNKPSWAPQPGTLPRALRLRLPPDEPELTPLLLNH